jgi:hypothetical protein
VGNLGEGIDLVILPYLYVGERIMDWLHVGLTAMGGMLVVIVPLLVKAYLDIHRAKTETDKETRKERHGFNIEQRQELIAEHEKARLNLLKEYDQLRDEMRKEIQTLREQILKLQEANISYALENVNCKARIREFETEIAFMRRQFGYTPGSPSLITTETKLITTTTEPKPLPPS